jgi:endoglucanase
VDGFDKGLITLTSSTFGNYPFSVSGIGSGSHQIRIKFINDNMTTSCDRNAYLDYYTLTSSNTTTPPTDTDGDGVADSFDQCPTQSGPSSNNGCPLPPPANQTNPFANQKFYVNPNSDATRTEAQWRAAGRTADADQMHKIARNPDIFYFSEWTQNAVGGTPAHVDWQTDQIYAQGAMPVYGVYAVPNRDCGAYSSGGFTTGDQYRGWINDVVAGLQGRKAIFIVEPDGIASTDCLSSTQLQERFDLIHYAVNKIEAEGSAAYIDGSNCFAPDGFISDRLKLAGIADAHGFSRNISNFCYTSSEIQHGTTISNAVGGKHFIIDTSRNGLGPYLGANNWCNPPGRALGPEPTANTGNTLVDAYYWLKRPGESDGSCNGNPSAGTWMPDYALQLAQRTSW